MRTVNNGPKIIQERKTVTAMIELYCKKNHHTQGLCDACQDLQNYAMKRLDFCRFGEEKGTCEKCSVHCYRADYRDKIKQVMRFSGPRMLLHHPVWAVRHVIKNMQS
jgi:hypothetical protein